MRLFLTDHFLLKGIFVELFQVTNSILKEISAVLKLAVDEDNSSRVEGKSYENCTLR